MGSGDGTAASIRSYIVGADGADTPEAAHFFGRGHQVGHLPAATTPPAPAPPSLADAAPLRPHEVFGFAPYWTLSSSSGFDVAGISTLAYFSLDVNPNGTLDESGAGWNGYQSQALSNLVTRAHAAGDRVVLTVTDFDQGSLNALTSSPAAATTLASALVAAVSAKNLDGVNLDLEGEGDADQAGLTRLVATVSRAVRAADPHDQVTMDTYASSATGTNGFYDMPALAPLVDAFFVMEYSPNLAASPSASSPLTSGLFSVQTTVDEYAAAVPPSKVILGLPYFGIDWPTTNGTLTATATGPATDVSLGDVLASGHPLYWDPVTDSGWTSYQVGSQWHETFFEDPPWLYDAAQTRNRKIENRNSKLAGIFDFLVSIFQFPVSFFMCLSLLLRGAEPLSFTQRLAEIRTGFERAFWVANLTELFERLAYYGASAVLAIYLTEQLHFSKELTGWMMGTFGFVVWLLPVLGGTLADRFGFRRALMFAYLVMTARLFSAGFAFRALDAGRAPGARRQVAGVCHPDDSGARAGGGQTLRGGNHRARFGGERSLHRLFNLLHDREYRWHAGPDRWPGWCASDWVGESKTSFAFPPLACS